MKILSIAPKLFINKIKLNFYSSKLFLNQPFDSFSFSGKHKSCEEIKNEKEKIKMILKKNFSEDSTISAMEIAKQVGLPEYTVKERIYSDEELSSLWNHVKSVNLFRYTKDEKDTFKKALGDLLEEASKNNQKISQQYLVEKLGVSKNIIISFIKENPYYSELYENVRIREIKHKKSKEETLFLEEQIRALCQEAYDNGKKTGFKEIADKIGIKADSVRSIIDRNQDLKELYSKVRKPIKRQIKGGIKTKKELIKNILENASNQNEKITLHQVIEKAGIAANSFYKIIKEDEEINALWSLVKKQEHQIFTQNDIQDLDNYMHRYFMQAKEQGEKLTSDEVAQHFGISKAYVFLRIKNNPSLKYQWNKVKTGDFTRYDEYERKEQIKAITDILKGFYQKGEKTTLKELSSMVNLPENTIISRIRSNQTTLGLWKKTRSINYISYSEKQIQKQYDNIRNIIQISLIQKTKISMRDIAKKLKISTDVVSKRIHSNQELSNLWNECILAGITK